MEIDTVHERLDLLSRFRIPFGLDLLAPALLIESSEEVIDQLLLNTAVPSKDLPEEVSVDCRVELAPNLWPIIVTHRSTPPQAPKAPKGRQV
jgi:hypothetical protein